MSDRDQRKEWFDIAGMDLASAEYLLGMRPLPVEIICYHCAQAAEKYLKGVLAAFDLEPPRSHDLVQLCKLCCQTDPEFEQLANSCIELTPYGVQVRYPSDLELTAEDAEYALRECRAIRAFAEQHISKENF